MPTYGVPVAGTEVKIVQVNRARTSLVIQNPSATEPVFFRDGAGISTENGLRLAPFASATYKIPEDDPTTAFFAITTGATVVVRVQEQMGTKPLPVRSA